MGKKLIMSIQVEPCRPQTLGSSWSGLHLHGHFQCPRPLLPTRYTYRNTRNSMSFLKSQAVCYMIPSMHDLMHFFFLFGWTCFHVQPPSAFLFCLTCQHLHRLSDLPHPCSRKPSLDAITPLPEPLDSAFWLIICV